MALNFPGPYGVRIYYTTTPTGFPAMTHKLEVNVRTSGTPSAGTPANDIDLIDYDGLTTELDAWVFAFVNLIKPLFNASTDFTYYELWKYEPLSFDASFITSAPLAIVGTAPGATVPAGQLVITFRTIEGGIMKLNLMESSIVAAAALSFPTANATIQALANSMVNPSTGVILGRDTGKLIAPKAIFPGQNERLFKKRYRNV